MCSVLVIVSERPIGKTAATVKAQVPVAVQKSSRVLEGRVLDCPPLMVIRRAR